MNRIICTILVSLVSQITNAQVLPDDNPRLINVLPPSPEAAAMVSAGIESISMFSGKAQASIPFYTLKLEDITIPIGLQYNSGGLRVDESPTKEGLGWSLSGIGVITRIVHGKPDDAAGVTRRTTPVAANPSNPTQEERLTFYDNVTSPVGLYDAEADEFSLAAPGLSIKFILDENGVIIPMSYTNDKITVNKVGGLYNNIVVVTASGVTFTFGGVGAIEKTVSQEISGIFKNFGGIATGFYLKQIKLNNQKTINFTYEGTTEYTCSGASESQMHWVENDVAGTCNNGSVTHCPGNIPDYSSHFLKINYAKYTNRGVKAIQTSDGQNITFNYNESSPNSYGYSFTSLQTVSVDAGDFHRVFNLTYTVPSTVTGTAFTPTDYASRIRFFLKDVSYTIPNTAYAETVKYKLEYNDYENLPSILSFSQDWLGYYNGTVNSNLLPAIQNDNSWGMFATADRKFRGMYAEKGMLRNIILPTGGSEQFNYEPNVVSQLGVVPSLATLGTGGTGFTTSTPPVAHAETYESAIFHIYLSQTATMHLSGRGGNGNLPGHVIGMLGATLVPLSPGGTDYTMVGNDAAGTASEQVAIIPGDYKLRIKVKQGYGGDVSLDYDRSDASGLANDWSSIETGGVRVKSIESYDPLTLKTKTKYFTYAEKNLLSRSSGESLVPDNPLGESTGTRLNVNTDGCQQGVDWYVMCPALILSTNTLVPSVIFGDHMNYQYVIESDDPGFKNGGIQHKFNMDRFPTVTTVLGFSINNIPLNTSDRIRGSEIQTDYFDNNLNTVKKTESNYIVAPNYSSTTWSYNFRKKFDYHGFCENCTTPEVVFDETKYAYISKWNQIHSISTTNYANGVMMSNTIEYAYNEQPPSAPMNISPIKMETTDSKNIILKTEIKYPTDYADPIFITMVTKNMINTPINTKVFRAGYEIKSTTTYYKDWINNGLMIKPEIISQSQNGNVEENRIRYYRYDIKGNPVTMSKENDVNLTYIWGYDHNFPVAEVNTDKPIVYSSLEEPIEESSWSGINPSFILTSPTTAMTGKKYYQQSNFVFTRSSLSGNYVVTYWSNNTNAYTVTGNLDGWPKLLKTVNHAGMIWNLFEHHIEISPEAESNFSISGSGAIDELRCYPTDAVMKTFTYSPYVGISSQCDENNNITYFEYDGLQRLTLVRDIDRNILKKICYNYAGQPENCGIIRYFNDIQQNSFTPTTCPPNTTANSVIYTVPANTYSSTVSVTQANQLALADLAANGQQYANDHPNCTSVVCNANNCTGKCINGACEQGVHKLISKVRHAEYDENGNRIWVWECDWISCYSDNSSEPWYPPYGSPEANCANMSGAAGIGTCP